MTKAPAKKKQETAPPPDDGDPDDDLLAFEKEAAEMMGNAVGEDMLGIVEEIANVQLRPVTMATIALLKTTGNDHISGKTFEEIPNLSLDTAKFVILQDASRSVREAVAITRDPELFEGMAYELMETIPAEKNAELNMRVILAIKDAMMTQVKALPEKGAKPDDVGKG